MEASSGGSSIVTSINTGSDALSSKPSATVKQYPVQLYSNYQQRQQQQQQGVFPSLSAYGSEMHQPPVHEIASNAPLDMSSSDASLKLEEETSKHSVLLSNDGTMSNSGVDAVTRLTSKVSSEQYVADYGHTHLKTEVKEDGICIPCQKETGPCIDDDGKCKVSTFLNFIYSV